MLGQVECGAISVASDLNPTVASLNFSIPAVVSVVGHLVRAMLSKADCLTANTDRDEEHISPCDEVTKSLITNDALADSLTDRHHDRASFTCILSLSCPQRKLDVAKRCKLGATFILWVDKVLDFSHRELTDTEETLSRRNLVTESKADLSSSKGETAIVEFNKTTEIDEHTLSCLGAKIAFLETGRANLGIEHQIERNSWRKRVSSVRVLNVHPSNDGINLLGREVFNVSFKLKELLTLIGLLALLKLFADELLNKFVSTTRGSSLSVLDHKVLKLVNVARGLKHLTEHQARAADLEHVLFKHKVLPPELLDIVLDSTAKRTVVEETCDTTVDLEAWYCEELALHQILDITTLVLLGQVFGWGHLRLSFVLSK